ncbi:hypothetical protein RJ640_003084 [Escallonia rubra]|uniref:NAC domain-containing protein n=1 Tax=Escallonia rubra TaxID=112253 RepID=A0AA88R2A6_9ASTE|nr:hypothetical protein RJ640_003084 [Escallonia rubra]
MESISERRDAEAELNLPPGFRFHPTDEELVVYYLCRKAAGYLPLPVSIIAEIDLYKHDPWQLPDKALFGTKEWYFFTPRDRKYPNGSRPNRAAGSGYWKATGADKPIKSPTVMATGSTKSSVLGIKKALVFYHGKAPKGIKTNWIMHEYRLAQPNQKSTKKGGVSKLDDWVLCRLYNKKNNREEKIEEHSGVESGDTLELESDVDNDTMQDQADHGCRLPYNSQSQTSFGISYINNTMLDKSDHDYKFPSNGQLQARFGNSNDISLVTNNSLVSSEYYYMEDENSGPDWLRNMKLEDLQESLAAMPMVASPHGSCYSDYFSAIY